jgi:hypothetical protein
LHYTIAIFKWLACRLAEPLDHAPCGVLFSIVVFIIFFPPTAGKEDGCYEEVLRISGSTNDPKDPQSCRMGQAAGGKI